MALCVPVQAQLGITNTINHWIIVKWSDNYLKHYQDINPHIDAQRLTVRLGVGDRQETAQ